MLELDHLSFQQLVSSTDKLVIVEFYMERTARCARPWNRYTSSWPTSFPRRPCSPEVDAQVHIDMALQYGVVGTPTFKLFCRDKFLGEIVGETNATVLRNTIKDMIRHQVPCSTRVPRMTFELDGYG